MLNNPNPPEPQEHLAFRAADTQTVWELYVIARDELVRRGVLL